MSDMWGNVLEVQKAGAAVGSEPKLNFIEGANVAITVVDNPGAGRIDITIASSGGGGGGSVTASGPPVAGQVAYWTSPTDITGDPGLQYDGLNNLLAITGATGPQLELAYDVPNFALFTVDSGGNLTVDSSGGFLTIPDHVSITGVAGAPAAGESLSISPTASASGSKFVVAINGAINTGGGIGLLNAVLGASTGQSAGTEIQFVRFNLGATVTWAAGAIANERAVTFFAPTLAFAGASTVTNAATVYIDKAPVAGANATITNSYALWVASGITLLTTLNLTNPLTYLYGGTGLSTLGSAGQVLRVNAAGTAIEWGTAAASSTDASIMASYLTLDQVQRNPMGRKLIAPNINRVQLVDTGPMGYAILTGPQDIHAAASPTFLGLTLTTLSLGSAVSGAETVSISNSSTIQAAAGAVWNAVNIKAGTATLSGTTTISTATGFNFVSIARPSINRQSGSVTVTNSASLYIADSPLAGTGVTISNPYSIWVDSGTSRFDGQILMAGLGAADIAVQGATGTGFGGNSLPSAWVIINSQIVTTWNANTINFAVPASSLAIATYTFVKPSNVNATVEGTIFHVNLSATNTHSTSIATQRDALFTAGTHSGFSAAFPGAITNAATVAITGAPIQGSNMTITNSYALWIQSGASRFDGAVTVASISITTPLPVASGGTGTTIDLLAYIKDLERRYRLLLKAYVLLKFGFVPGLASEIPLAIATK